MPNRFTIPTQNQDELLTGFDDKTSAPSLPFGKETEGKIDPFQAVLSPGSTFAEPGLKKLGIPSGLAFGIGLGVDIATPGVGSELKAGINILKDASRIPATIYRGLLKNLTGIDSLREMNIRQLQVVKSFLDSAPKSVEGKIIVSDIPNIRGVKLSREFAEKVGSMEDFGQVESSAISILDPLRAAEKLDRSENGIIKRTFIRPVQEADSRLLQESKIIINRVKSFVGKIKSGSEQDRLIRIYGERDIYPESYTPQLANKITPEIKNAAEGFRQLYDELLERLNKARKFAGQKEINKRKDYFTHAEELGILSSLFGKITKIPGEMLRIAEFTKPNAPWFRFALPRLGRNTTAGALEGFQRYLNSALPIIHYAEPIVNMRAHIPYLPPRASQYFNNWVNELAGKTSALDRPFPKQLLAIGDWLRTHTSQGSVLGNFTTAFSQLSSVASTLSRAGLKKTLAAIPVSLSDTGIAFAEKTSKVLQARRYDPDINPDTLGNIKNFLGWGLQTLDRFAVRHSFLANYAKAIDKLGLDPEDAIRYADDLAQKTQASTRKIFQPPFLRSRLGGTLGQLQTFTTNLYNQIRRDIPLIKKTQGGFEAVKTAMTLGISAILINKVYREAGLPEPYSLTSFIPGTGSIRYGSPTPALKGGLGVAKVAFGQCETREEGVKDVRDFIFSLIPGGRQLQKTVSGIEAIGKGGSYTKGGRERFPIEGTAEEFRALLFGPWQTKAGQEYLKDLREKD